jgi:hypothetical protein
VWATEVLYWYIYKGRPVQAWEYYEQSGFAYSCRASTEIPVGIPIEISFDHKNYRDNLSLSYLGKMTFCNVSGFGYATLIGGRDQLAQRNVSICAK